MDLTEVEGVADLLAAETEQQRALALQNAAGALRSAAHLWRQRLLRCMAHIEAVIDFGEDENLSEDVAATAHSQVYELADDIRKHLANGVRGELIRDGIRVAIVGPPNVGKSSLLNYLAKRDAAIVSDTPGTTRDVLNLSLDVGGYKITVMDTAGLREAESPIEEEGMRRALAAVREASIVLVMLDASTSPPPQPAPGPGLTWAALLQSAAGSDRNSARWLSEVAAITQNSSSGAAIAAPPALSTACTGSPDLESELPPRHADESVTGSRNICIDTAPMAGEAPSQQVLVVYNKADLLQSQRRAAKDETSHGSAELDRTSLAHVVVSCKSGHNLEELMNALQATVKRVIDGDGGPGLGEHGTLLVTRQRQRVLLQECLAALERYRGVQSEHELAAEELRAAAHALGKLTGGIDPEAVLDVLFAEFCIGK